MKELTLREARQRRKLTQDELAIASDVDQTTISDLETGRNTNPRHRTIQRFAKALRIAPYRLRFDSPQPERTIPAPIDRVGQKRAEAAQ